MKLHYILEQLQSQAKPFNFACIYVGFVRLLLSDDHNFTVGPLKLATSAILDSISKVLDRRILGSFKFLDS